MNKRAIIFIDANNWYHNVKHWFKPSNIDIIKLGNLISQEYNLDIVEIRWYASMPSIKDNELTYKLQRAFLGNLQKQGVKIITRKLQRLSNYELKKKRKEFIESWDLCNVCKPIVKASFLDISDNKQKEKGIDVWIAIDMVKEAVLNNLDTAILISGDADFVPAFNLIKEVKKEVLSCSVPRGYSNELREKFPKLILTREKLTTCLKDYKVVKKEGENKKC